MGHGFSRMLQMVNEEIIKNIESKENKGYVSDEDRKIQNNNRSKYNDSGTMYENKSIKLPKVKQKNFNNERLGLTVNKFNMSTSPYEENDSLFPDEPRVTKIYKLNNRKTFTFNRASTEGNDIRENKREGNLDNNSGNNTQMDLTNPNDKK